MATKKTKKKPVSKIEFKTIYDAILITLVSIVLLVVATEKKAEKTAAVKPEIVVTVDSALVAKLQQKLMASEQSRSKLMVRLNEYEAANIERKVQEEFTKRQNGGGDTNVVITGNVYE